MNNLIIYGGSFDPIHWGHINIAKKIQEKFHFERFIFLPCKSQVLKNSYTQTSAKHRVNMLNLALLEQPQNYNFEIDLCEINRKTPSYTIITLKHYREFLGSNIAITLLMGKDAFSELPLWHEWEEILSYANILVVNRPGIEEKKSPEILQEYQTKKHRLLLESPHGNIYHFNAGAYNYSSTEIRHHLEQGITEINSLPASVLDYIKEHKLYML